MNPGLAARGLLAIGLTLGLAILVERMTDLRQSVSVIEVTVVALGSKLDLVQPGSESHASRLRVSPELGLVDLFSRAKSEPSSERVQPVKAPDPPAPPTFSYRYLGRVQAKHFLERDGQLIPIDVGTPLQDGFEILTIDERQIIARHKPTGLPVTISLPTQRE
jgi:hypothetical protein